MGVKIEKSAKIHIFVLFRHFKETLAWYQI